MGEDFLGTDKLVIIDFWAEWCGPCKVMSPLMDKLFDEYDEGVDGYKISVDDEPELARKYSVRSIPTLLFLKDDEVVERISGKQTEQYLKETIEKHL